MRLEKTPAEAEGHFDDLQEAFFAAFVAAGLPKHAAMYVSKINASEDAFYFSPAASSFLSAGLAGRKAQPCSPPSEDSLTLLVCNEVDKAQAGKVEH